MSGRHTRGFYFSLRKRSGVADAGLTAPQVASTGRIGLPGGPDTSSVRQYGLPLAFNDGCAAMFLRPGSAMSRNHTLVRVVIPRLALLRC
jgi:hypothetical protein